MSGDLPPRATRIILATLTIAGAALSGTVAVAYVCLGGAPPVEGLATAGIGTTAAMLVGRFLVR